MNRNGETKQTTPPLAFQPFLALFSIFDCDPVSDLLKNKKKNGMGFK
jgi:hypothetical protein